MPGKVQHPKCQGCWRSLANEQNLWHFCLKVNLLGWRTPRTEGPHFSGLTKQIDQSLCLFSVIVLGFFFVCFFIILLLLHVVEFGPRLASIVTHHLEVRFRGGDLLTSLTSNHWKP